MLSTYGRWVNWLVKTTRKINFHVTFHTVHVLYVNRKNCIINCVNHKFWFSDVTTGYRECEYAISANQIEPKARYWPFSKFLSVNRMALSTAKICAVQEATIFLTGNRKSWFFLLLLAFSFYLMKIPKILSTANFVNRKFCSFNAYPKWNVLGGYFWLRSNRVKSLGEINKQ